MAPGARYDLAFTITGHSSDGGRSFSHTAVRHCTGHRVSTTRQAAVLCRIWSMAGPPPIGGIPPYNYIRPGPVWCGASRPSHPIGGSEWDKRRVIQAGSRQ